MKYAALLLLAILAGCAPKPHWIASDQINGIQMRAVCPGDWHVTPSFHVHNYFGAMPM